MTTATITLGSPLAIAIANLPMHAEVINDIRQALYIPYEKRNAIESGVAILYTALDQGLISARAAAKHTDMTIEDLHDLFVAYGHDKPFDI
jgi:hypothetical protein